MSQTVSEKRLARARLYELVDADNQRKTMLNAYKIKAELLQEQRQKEKADPNPTHCLIRTLDPLVIPPEGKFQHRSGALISPHTLSKSLELKAQKSQQTLTKSASTQSTFSFGSQ